MFKEDLDFPLDFFLTLLQNKCMYDLTKYTAKGFDVFEYVKFLAEKSLKLLMI